MKFDATWKSLRLVSRDSNTVQMCQSHEKDEALRKVEGNRIAKDHAHLDRSHSRVAFLKNEEIRTN